MNSPQKCFWYVMFLRAGYSRLKDSISTFGIPPNKEGLVGRLLEIVILGLVSRSLSNCKSPEVLQKLFPSTRLVWALRGSKVGKRVRKWVAGASRPRGRAKSREESRKRGQMVLKVSILTRFRVHFGLLRPPGPRGHGNSFRTPLATLGPSMTPVAGPENPNRSLLSHSSRTFRELWRWKWPMQVEFGKERPVKVGMLP